MAHSGGGRFDDDLTRKTGRPTGAGNEPTRIVGGGGGGDDATRIISDPSTGGYGGGGGLGPGGTVIGVAGLQQGVRVGAGFAGGLGAAPDGQTEYLPPQPEQGDQAGGAFDPVVAWLTIRRGPGRGNVRTVHYGSNSIGRGADQRISIDFGDARISREAHAFIVYDDKQRKFYLRDNGKSNLVRHNDSLVMVPTELKDRDQITIGDTTLMFIALCNADFDWLAEDAQTKA